MKNIIFAVCLLVLISSTAWAGDFRGANWGMTVNEVKKTENTKPDFNEQNALGYTRHLFGCDFGAIYIFAQKQLVRGKYVLFQKYNNSQKYVRLYDQIVEGLTQKYGKPAKENKYFDSEYYRNTPSKWGVGVAAGKVEFFTQWDHGDTVIIAYLGGENFKISCLIEYSSNKLEHLEDDAREKATQEQL